MLIIAIIILASSASFGLGYLAGRESGQVGRVLLQESASATEGSSAVVASKSGTKYYFPSCPGASRIAEANKVWFVSPAAAEAAGYTRSSNCLNN